MGKTEDMFDEMLNETESFFIPSDDGKKERTKSDFAPNVDGEFFDSKFECLAARIFHHEMDHMKGNTFLDGVSKILLQSARKKQKILLRKTKKDDV